MRKYIYTIFVGLLLVYCDGGNDVLASPPKNSAPTVPILTVPANNNQCINNVVSFQWNASTDAQNDPITYQLQIATDNQFTQVVQTTQSALPIQTATLNKATAYYWRVRATDSKNASSSYSSTYSFYTEDFAQTNHMPFLPQLFTPVHNSLIAGTTTTLSWSASDVDTGNVLSYDVYLGTVNPPTAKVANGISTTSFNTGSLLSATIYYWKVVVKDNMGGETIGQTWNFKTN
ncbi:glycoside hydrolase family 78 protein [Flavobacterium flavipallidum]|uniref:Fibronectin type-III domain-containing protein n=1 Tax=Flavobacterium flavipallidum TaxID=3139140 RepID=A0ABU9HPN1_9FLAO